MSIKQDISKTSLEDLTNVAEDNGEESAEELIDELVDEGTDLLQSAGIEADKPLNTNYSSTDSFQDAVINGWAGAMSSKNSKLSIKGVELSKGINDLRNTMDDLFNEIETENEPDNKTKDSDENTAKILEQNAFNITVHELFHYNQDQEFVGEVASDRHSAEAFYDHFTDKVFENLYEEEISYGNKPSEFLSKAVEQEFEYSLGVIISHMSGDERQLFAEEISEDYDSWRECSRKNEEKTQIIGEAPLWLDNGSESPLGGLSSSLMDYEMAVSKLESAEDEEEFEEYLSDIEDIIDEDSENYEDDSRFNKSPEQVYQSINQVRKSKEEIIENNKKKREHEESAKQYIINVLNDSGLGEPVSKPFKEAFAHMTTLALQNDLNDEKARKDYLDRVEEGYNDDSAWGYDEDAGTVLRDITETVIEENGEIEGSTENQIERIHQLQSEYADQHRISYTG